MSHNEETFTELQFVTAGRKARQNSRILLEAGQL